MGWLKRLWGALTSPTGKQAEKFVLGTAVDILGRKYGVGHPYVATGAAAIEAALSGDAESAMQAAAVAARQAAGVQG